MRGGKLPHGYTIVEVMVVLVVSSLLLTVAATAISGQQSKAEYTQAIRDLETKITDIANDVNNGYFPAYQNINCDASGPRPDFAAGINKQGANKDCIFIGKAIQFEPSGEPGKINIITLVGKRLNGSVDSGDLLAAAPVAAYKAGVIDLTEKSTLSYGLKVQSVNGASTLAFLTKFNQTTTLSGGASAPIGTTYTSLYKVNGTALNAPISNIYNALATPASYQQVSDANRVELCVVKDGKYSKIILGTNNSQLTTETQIGVAPC